MRGFWADERVEGGIWDKNNPIFKRAYNFFKGKEIEFFNESDAIVSLTNNGKQEIESWDNLPNRPQIEVIPCCVDLNHFRSEKVDKVALEAKRTQLGILKDDFVLGYVGSIGTWYMLPEMLDYYRSKGLGLFRYIYCKNFALRNFSNYMIKILLNKNKNYGWEHISFYKHFLRNLIFPNVYLSIIYFFLRKFKNAINHLK